MIGRGAPHPAHPRLSPGAITGSALRLQLIAMTGITVFH